MNQQALDLVKWVEQEERKRLLQNPPAPQPPPERPTIHWTELQEDTSGGQISREWNFYLKQVGRLLAEGHEGHWVLIVGEEIIGVWNTEQEAQEVRAQKFRLQDVLLLRQVREREPLVRGPMFLQLCLS